MPPVVVGAIAAGAAAAGAAAIAGTAILSAALVSFGTSLVLGGLSYALTPKPKKPSFDNSLTNKGSTVAIRQPDLTRQHIFGHTRVTRGYAHMASTDDNGNLHMILILCEGPLRAINEIWLNDYVIPNEWINPVSGGVTEGRYSGHMLVRKVLGTETQGADSLAVSRMPGWTNDHRLAGVAYLYLMLAKDIDVWPTGVPNVSAVVEGPEFYDPREGTTKWSTNIALYCRDFLTNDEYGFGVFNDDIDDTNIAAQANICDEIVETTPEEYSVEEVDISLNLLELDGDLLQYQFGDRVQVSSTGSLPGGLSSSTNYYIIPYQVKTLPRVGLATSLDNAMAKEYIDISSVGSGNITITKTGEPRYHGSGVVDTETPLSDTLNNFASSMAGRAICVGGFWTLLAGAWRNPTLSLGIGDIRGNGITFKNALTMAESFNVIKGLFVSSTSLYQSTDYPTISYPQFIQEDNSLESPRELNLPFTNRSTTAQRIAKIELFRGRQDIVYKSDFSTKALQVQPGDNVNLNIDRLGWENKEFEITDFAFDVNNGSLVTKLSLRETAQAIFDWSSGEAVDFDAAPNTALPNPFDVLAPTGVAYNSRVIGTQEGDELYMLTLKWDLHPDAFVTEFGDFEVQFKLSSDTLWRPSFFVDGGLTETDVTNSSVNIFYDLRIRARNNLGVRSGWVTLLGVVAGSSGGVGATYDYEFVNDSVSVFNEWGSVEDSPVNFEDWEYVA